MPQSEVERLRHEVQLHKSIANRKASYIAERDRLYHQLHDTQKRIDALDALIADCDTPKGEKITADAEYYAMAAQLQKGYAEATKVSRYKQPRVATVNKLSQPHRKLLIIIKKHKPNEYAQILEYFEYDQKRGAQLMQQLIARIGELQRG